METGLGGVVLKTRASALAGGDAMMSAGHRHGCADRCGDKVQSCRDSCRYRQVPEMCSGDGLRDRYSCVF